MRCSCCNQQYGNRDGKGKDHPGSIEVTNKAVMEALDGLPPVKVHCSLLAEEAIHAALWDYAQKHNIKIEGLEKPKSDISEGEEEITSEAKEFKRHNSELKNSLNAILKVISIIIVPLGALLFYKQYYIVAIHSETP